MASSVGGFVGLSEVTTKTDFFIGLSQDFPIEYARVIAHSTYSAIIHDANHGH